MLQKFSGIRMLTGSDSLAQQLLINFNGLGPVESLGDVLISRIQWPSISFVPDSAARMGLGPWKSPSCLGKILCELE